MVSCHICNNATEEVMSCTLSLISRSHGKWSRVTSDVMSHMTSCHKGSHVTYSVYIKESCHVQSHVRDEVMSQRESCHAQCLYQSVMSHIGSCQIWSHVT